MASALPVEAAESSIQPAVGKLRRPAVLQVLPALVTGGVERGTVDIAAALVQSGWTAIVASAGGPMVREVERAGATHVTLSLESKNPLSIHANIGRLARIIGELEVDIVHARSRAPAWSAYYAARRTGRRFVTTFHSPYTLGFPGKRWYNQIMARGERVIAISHFVADHVLANYKVDPERLRVVPRGVDIDSFDTARVYPGRIIQLAEAWRLPDGVPVVMLPGRLTRWKGHTVLIDALARLRRKQPGRLLRCIFVGSDQGRTGYRRELEERARRNGLADTLQIVDDCRDMPAAYMLADVVVSASTDPEGFGRVAIEAQAMGKPVIATNHGAARETVIDGSTGLLTRPGDPDALADALERMLALSTAEREALAARAIDNVRRGFTKQQMCERTLAIYHELLDYRDLVELPVGTASGHPGDQ